MAEIPKLQGGGKKPPPLSKDEREALRKKQALEMKAEGGEVLRHNKDAVLGANPKPSQLAFHGRDVYANERMIQPLTNFPAIPVNKVGLRLSSYPHLTKEIKADGGGKGKGGKGGKDRKDGGGEGRAAHLTDIRRITEIAVAERGRFTIHERFHQDDDAKAEKKHDRFLATDEHGVVHTATTQVQPGTRVPLELSKSMERDMPLMEDERRRFTVFVVGERIPQHPPLSPRSRRR